MNFALRHHRGAEQRGSDRPVEATSARPGLPVALAGAEQAKEPQAAEVRDIARQAAAARSRDEEARYDRNGKKERETGNAGAQERGAQVGEAEKPEAPEAAREGGAGESIATESEAGEVAWGQTGATVTTTPVGQGQMVRPDIFRSVNAPALPPTPIPDLSRIRSITVLPPPASAIRRAADILRATGSTPVGHHAQIQRGIDSLADRARAGQRNVIFEVGGISAGARHSIESLAERIPGIVGGGVARIRTTAASVIADANAHADAQISAVLTHKAKADAGLATRGKDTEVSMQQMLMKEAPQLLKDAKAAMDAEINGLAEEAGTRIAGIKSGTKPAAMDTGVAPEPGAKPADTATSDGGEGGEQYTTWPAAREALTNRLMGELPGNYTAQYGNLQCAAALPPMVEAQQRAYETANAETIKGLTSEENKARFFDITFGLIMPTVGEEQEKADPVADESYTGHLNANLSEQYSRLDSATQRIVRQIDEKRGVLVDQTLNPSYEKSLPAQSIKGLQQAGKKIMDGLRDQARVVEASLKANLKSLAAQYPDLVARLEPLVASGEFLEATATLAQLADAERSIGALEGGQIASVAEQAVTTLANARKGFDAQVASLHKMTGSSIDSLFETLARARYDFVRTTMLYTGTMDKGVAAVFPQIHAHATQVAERLLGPKNSSRQQFSNIKTSAIGYINGVISAEWQGYLARVNSLEKGFGGVADASWTAEDSGSEFGRIRNGAAQDASARGNDVRSALTPAPLSTAGRVGGYVLFGVGGLAYDIYSNPDESKVTVALSIPWPGPRAVDERHKADSGTGVIQLIEERMESEEEQADILKLFNPDQNVRAAGKAGLLEGSSASTGINNEAALALSRSLTADELASPIMSPERRARIAEELRSTLKRADMEVAAAYLNGEPDQALAIRMRQLFDRQAKKEERDQLQTGEELDKLIRQELFAGGQYAYVPQARLDGMRDAAFLRFDEISREGRQPVTVRDTPVAPPADRLALSPAQLRYQGRPPPPPPPRREAQKAAPAATPRASVPSIGPTAKAPPTPVPAPPLPTRALIGPQAPNEVLTPEGVATDRTRKLDEARLAIVAYMNKPHTTYKRRPEDRYAEADMRRFSAMDRKVRTYDPVTGKVTIAPALAIQAYNTAVIMHGTTSPEAMGARAAASYSRISPDGSLSTNQINELNQNFSNSEYARFRVRWQNATPAQKVVMQQQWDDVQARHRTFLRETARGMGLADNLDNPAVVEAYVAGKLGKEFAKEGSEYRRAGREIVSQGRMSIDTGVALAADGAGTNEVLMQNVLANRTHAEFNVRRANGETMHDYAYRVADDEMSGDDWHQAKEKLRGEDENELERYATLRFLKDQQLEEGTGWLGESVMADAWQKRHLEGSERAAEGRLRDATRAGIDDYNKRMDAAGRPDLKINPISEDFPVRLPGGQLNPLVGRFAMNGDGKLRGKGPSMDVLQTNTRQAADFYQQEIDRNESIFTSLITALAVIVSVILLIIPGVNLIAAGILVALISGAATIAVKSGMRGGRYGWEEMATDIGMTAIEAATAGIGGAMSKGATAAARAAQAGEKMAKLGRIASVGARIQTRFGPVAAPIIQGAMTGAASTAATAALDDKLWDDGIGRGIGRVLGNSVKGGLSGAANAAVTGTITRGLDRRLAPTALGKGVNADKLNRLGGSLGPGGREMLTELLSNTAGALSGESLNILADIAMDKHVGGWSGALERLGKAGLRELVQVGGRTGVQQMHRARYNQMSADIHAAQRNPTPAEARLLNRLGQSAGIVPLGTRTADYARSFSNVRARIEEIPPEIRGQIAKMGPDKAMDIIHMLDSGQLGNRAQRLQFTSQLGKEIIGLDVAAFDRSLQAASRDFAPTRRARKEAQAQTNRQVLSGIRGPERAHLQGQEFPELVGLPPTTKARLAAALAKGGVDFKALAHQLIPDDTHLAARVAARMTAADAVVTRARNVVATRRAGIRDDLLEAAPAPLRDQIAGLKQRDAETLHAALREGEPTGFARAAAILRDTGLDPDGAVQLTRKMMGRIMRTADRVANLDNVPAVHRRAMLDLEDDALMEIRVAQFVRKPLSDARVDEIVAATAGRRAGTDRAALAEAIRATMATRHGRPGFREALTQKRAFLDMIPFGMKRIVHRTPVITLPEGSFLAYVRGKGNEHAVTLIVNGEPVVLMRQGADPKVLAEEGLHVLQYRDPRFRERIESLGEQKMARWDDLDLDTKVRAYRTKLEVEIDGQERMIAKLRARAESGFFAATRAQAREQLAAAETTLSRLVKRRGEAAALSPDEIEKMAAGLLDPPGWLRQPARMFSKSPPDDALFNKLHPTAEAPLRQMLHQLPDMDDASRKQLVLALRTLKGAVPVEELVTFLGRFRKQPPHVPDPALAGISPDQIATTLLNHFLTVGETSQPGTIAAQLRDRLLAKPGLSDENRKLIATTLERLSRSEPGDSAHPELELAKRKMILALSRMPISAKNPDILERFNNAAFVLGISPHPLLSKLSGKPEIQATILEGLATNRSTLKAGHQEPVPQKVFFKAVMNVIDAGITDMPIAAQRHTFRFLNRMYFSLEQSEPFERIVDLVRVAKNMGGPESGRAERTFLIICLNQLERNTDQLTKLMPKLTALIENVVDIPAGPFAETAAAGKVTVREMLRYFNKALKEPAIQRSIIRFSHKARGDDPLADDVLAAIRTGQKIPAGQDLFLRRYSKPLPDAIPDKRYVPIIIKLEKAADDLVTAVNGTPTTKGAGLDFVMSIEEGRAIIQRLEVLESSVAFSSLTGKFTSRAELINEFLQTLRGKVATGTDEDSRNTRGKYIEEAFRDFVRQKALATMTRIVQGVDLPVEGGAPVKLSEEARVALANILIRGRNDVKRTAQPRTPAVAREIVDAIAVMRKAYLDAAGKGLPPDALLALRKAFNSLVARGVIETEWTAKGKMQEHIVETLLGLSAKPGVPKSFGQVSSATEDTSTEFYSPDGKRRNTDHVIRVEEPSQENLPPGMAPGQKIQTDSKAGSGAFDSEQFKRYFIEMARMAVKGEGFFADTDTASLAYIADNHTHLLATQRKVVAVLQEILNDPKATRLVIHIDDKDYDLTALYGITPADIRANAHKFVIHFGRIAQPGDAHAPANAPTQGPNAPPSTHPLGPFLFQTLQPNINDLIRNLLAEEDAITRSREGIQPEED